MSEAQDLNNYWSNWVLYFRYASHGAFSDLSHCQILAMADFKLSPLSPLQKESWEGLGIATSKCIKSVDMSCDFFIYNYPEMVKNKQKSCLCTNKPLVMSKNSPSKF